MSLSKLASEEETYIWNQSTVRGVVAPHDDKTPKRSKSTRHIRTRLVPTLQLLRSLSSRRRETLNRVVIIARSLLNRSSLCRFGVLRLLQKGRDVLEFDLGLNDTRRRAPILMYCHDGGRAPSAVQNQTRTKKAACMCIINNKNKPADVSPPLQQPEPTQRGKAAVNSSESTHLTSRTLSHTHTSHTA